MNPYRHGLLQLQGLFFTALMVLFLSCASGVQAQQNTCDIPNCDSVSWTSVTGTVITLPGYPDCPVEINYEYKQCPDGRVMIAVTSISTSPTTGSNCSTLEAKEAPGGVIDWNFIDWEFRMSFWELSKKLFMDRYNNLYPWEKHTMECPNGSQTYTALWATCEKRVAYRLTHGGSLRKARFKCGDLCCLEELTYCYNKQTQTLEMQRSQTPQNEDCDSLSEPSIPSHWLVVAQTGCVPACEWSPIPPQ